MVSFSCEGCGDVLTKKKLDGHRNMCYGDFTCLDCMNTFHGNTYKSHNSCISEAQKYQGHLYRDPKGKRQAKEDTRKSAMVPKGAYVEDAPEGDDMNSVAVVEVPPRAPTPPPVAEPVGELPDNINVFDFLVSDATPKAAQLGAADKRKMLQDATPQVNSQYSQYSQLSNGNGSQFLQYGYSYGNAPIPPGMERFDSWNNMTDSQRSQAFVTPANKDQKRLKKDKGSVDKSEKKRKRNLEELDLSSAKRPQSSDLPMSAALATGSRTLHTGLTGGLSRLVTGEAFYDDPTDRIDAGPTPVSPLKRAKREKELKDHKSTKEERRKSSYVSYSTKSSKDDKRYRSRSPERERRQDKHEKQNKYEKRRRNHRDDSASSEERSRVSRRSKAIEYPDRSGSVQPSSTNALMSHSTRAGMFLSFINKGPESQHGLSMNKVLKRYHRERELARPEEKEDEDKELWKSLRLRRNSRGEIVLFM